MSDILDVRCLPYMPLQIEQLRKSKTWLKCRRRPELGFYLMNLWMRAWHELPAGSIEDDDDILADAAMCSPEKWEELRPLLLDGWERRDGRVYHRTVTEIATDGFSRLRKNRGRTEAARLAAEAARRDAESNPTAPVTESVTEAVTDSVTKAVTGTVTDTVTEPEGKGREGKRKIKEEPIGSSKKRAVRLPKEWVCPSEWIDEAVGKGLTRAKAMAESERMKNWSLSNSRGAKLDWLATWRNWYTDKLEAPRDPGRDADGNLTNDFLFGRG